MNNNQRVIEGQNDDEDCDVKAKEIIGAKYL